MWVDTDGLEKALTLSPVPLSTMGRGYPEERAYFLAAAAAGRYAALAVPVPPEAGAEPEVGAEAPTPADGAPEA